MVVVKIVYKIYISINFANIGLKNSMFLHFTKSKKSYPENNPIQTKSKKKRQHFRIFQLFFNHENGLKNVKNRLLSIYCPDRALEQSRLSKMIRKNSHQREQSIFEKGSKSSKMSIFYLKKSQDQPGYFETVLQKN